MSDTVNTGLYVLEPEVLDLIPPNVIYDFSSDLVPRMLAERLPLYGCIADGYWCDIGAIEEYRRANADLLFGHVNTPEPIGNQDWRRHLDHEDVDIAPSAQLYGPIYLGSGVKIKGM